MAQLFPPYANTLARLAVPCGVLGCGVLAWAFHTTLFSSYATGVGVPVEQPVPFSHQHHVGGLGIDCRYCHTAVEKSSYAGMPPTETCFNCHSQIWVGSDMLEPVRESYRSGQSLKWQRVYNLPGFVYFDHSIHIHKGIGCTTCHGRIDEMPLTYQKPSLLMEWCLDCHRAPEKHLRPKEEVFNMTWEPPGGDQLAIGRELVKQNHIPTDRLTNCSTCHR